MIKRLDHVAIAVNSIAETLEDYRRLIGWGQAHIEEVPQQGVKAALLAVPGAEVELLEPTDPQGAVARFLERRGEGLHHICLEVDDIAAELERLKASEVPLVDQQARPGLAGMVAFLHPRASHGVLIELAQKTGHEPSAGEPPPGVTGLEHIGIIVKELAQAFASYERTLARPRGDRVGDYPAFRLGFIHLGNSELELVEPTDPEQSWGRFLAERGEGLHHFALGVTDLPQRVETLRQAGVKLVGVHPPEEPRYAFIHHSFLHGVLIEFVQKGGGSP